MSSIRNRNKRLQKEYAELLACPVANCSAQPLENDISVWHANIWVESLEVAFHFEIRYPVDYPKRAPKVKPFTTIKHQNVFGDAICLDILTMSTETANTPYRGWTSAYTISSLLVQLESFLFEAVPDASSYAKSSMKDSARRFRCSCGHNYADVCPPISCFGANETKVVATTKDEEEIKEICFLEECDNVILAVLCEMLDADTLIKISRVSSRIASFPNRFDALDLALAKDKYTCFYTRQKYGEDNLVLGIGAKAFIMDRRSRKTRRKTAQLQQLHCSFDFLSHDAFKQGVRNNVWKDRDFDYFIPLYINKSHGKISLPLAEKCITDLWCDPRITNNRRVLTPATILETLTKMMNTTVVNMMKTVEDLDAGELQLFDSIKAIEGFCSIHHLLLAFADKYPDIITVANNKVKRFIEDPQMRDKEVTPDIGELMIDVALSKYSWDDFSPAWLQETFIRNARWICAKYPNLLDIEQVSSCVRLTQSYNATKTGKRLAMFQRFFISEIASPKRLQGNPQKNAILLKEYSLRLGLPQKGMAERLQAHSRKVIGCDNWWDYFSLIDFCAPGVARLGAWLRNCVRISEMKNYHQERNILRYDEHHLVKPSETDQLNERNCLCAGSLFQLPEGCKIISGEQQPQMVRKTKQGIDICFVMDCTGSMTSWIATAKQRIKEIIQSVSRKADGVVRFAIVGYRDHDSPGYGSDSWTLKKYDFTSSGSEAKERVALFNVGGGGGHEAMCCAMEAAANMSWNRDSHQIVVLIGDQPPHGFGGRGDYSFPNGCPCGSDTLRVVHTMEKNGIVVYPVDCGRKDANRETFYHALARITGGYAINLKESSLLPEIVFGACMEEKCMDKLAGVIAPFYDNCLKSHGSGRFEQHCRSVYAELNAKKIKVESCLPADNYDETIEHQVDCLAYCMDIQQAKVMCQKEYFIPITRQTKFCSYMERPVTQGQVTKCMKRMESKMSEMAFLKNGCQYKSSARFTKEAFTTRWTKFKQERRIRHFNPWNKIKPEDVRKYETIPDGSRIRQGDLKLGLKASVNVPKNTIGMDLVGKEIQVKVNGTWKKVFVCAVRSGTARVKTADGFSSVIPITTPWKLLVEKTVEKKSPWGAKGNSATAPKPPAVVHAPAPVVPPTKAPAVVRAPAPVVPPTKAPAVVRASVPAPSKAPAVVHAPVVAPAPVLAPPTQIPAPTMAKNVSVEVPEAVANNRTAVVNRPRTAQQVPRTNVSAQSDSGRSDYGRSISRSASVGRSPPSASAPHNFVLGQIVECMLNKNDASHVGTVISVEPLILRVQGFTDGRWRFVRARKMITEVVLQNSEAVYMTPSVQLRGANFRINSGTKIEILEYVGDFAHVISPVEGWIQINKTANTVNPICAPKPKITELVLSHSVRVYRKPNVRSQEVSLLAAGMRVQILEKIGEFSHIISPESGYINVNEKVDTPVFGTPTVAPPELPIGASRISRNTTMLPTIECFVSSGISAKGLAMACERSGALPKKVSIKLIDNRRVGVVAFENLPNAELILSRGISCSGQPILIKWSQEFLQEASI
jgi:ubiquitin-protein ligase/Mg-chelatase subunit ChlD